MVVNTMHRCNHCAELTYTTHNRVIGYFGNLAIQNKNVPVVGVIPYSWSYQVWNTCREINTVHSMYTYIIRHNGIVNSLVLRRRRGVKKCNLVY